MLSSNLTSLRDLHHDSVNMSSVTPMSLLNLSSYLNSLSPAFCGISGEIPRENLLAYNRLEGPLQDHTSGLQISGGLSFRLFTLPSLQILDLGYNKLTGPIEHDQIQLRNAVLQSLVLKNNDVNVPTRKFPNFLRTAESLYNFYLSNNKIEGPLLVPPPLVHVLDLSRNSLDGTIPECLGSLNRFLMFLQLQMNNFHGLVTKKLVQKFEREMEMMQLLSIFTAIDFSENLFYGHIPKELGALCSLQVLNLSHNHFNGPIPPFHSRIYQKTRKEEFALKAHQEFARHHYVQRCCAQVAQLIQRQSVALTGLLWRASAMYPK
ncbi:hypothetical protein Golob_027751 [Gossypium lobatum]|uniref:Uncharacterized protein n=1 Tax=Gossypium lobatum TaxID=34289 RepID=A0A7J8NKB1_9ROSI|nr:hypothetical protein [Gossypium lobatum]